MTQLATVHNWRAPRNDGGILLWPQGQELLAAVQCNRGRLSAATGVRIQDCPLPELRIVARRELVCPQEQPLLVTGHQAELLHPGIWAKNALIHVLAQTLAGTALHLAIDTDAPKHLQLRLPGLSLPITDDPALEGAAWSGLLKVPSENWLGRLKVRVGEAAASWPFDSMLVAFLQAMSRLRPTGTDLPVLLSSAMHELDRSLGLTHRVIQGSTLWMSTAYLALAHHILARCDSFVAAYNSALRDYRLQQNIRHLGRPWPDLHLGSDCCEVPFWLDDLSSGRRQRATVLRSRDGWMLCAAPSECLILDRRLDAWRAAENLRRFLVQSRLRLSPRALTLTAFVRMLVADLFVHGIGGGKYDRVTDRVLELWFGVAAPAFCVTTATLFFPSAAAQSYPDIQQLMIQGRRLRHGADWPEKQRFLRQIADLPRRSPQRAQLFFEMHRQLATILQQPRYKQWEQTVQEARRLDRQQAYAFDRELFYAIQSADRLGSLVEQYRLLLH